MILPVADVLVEAGDLARGAAVSLVEDAFVLWAEVQVLARQLLRLQYVRLHPLRLLATTISKLPNVRSIRRLRCGYSLVG